MALMNLNIDGVLTVEKVVVPADGITVLGHSLFRGEKINVRYNGDELTRGQDFIPDRIDDRLYFQKNVCLFTVLKISNESLFGQEIEVEYFACGDYINAEIWNEYPSSASLKQSLASKVDNSDFIEQIKRIDGDINKESTVRADADNTLQDNINIEANLRIAEDEKLQTNINNEAAARADADNTLQDNINAEEANRQSADAEIRADLENETNLRLAGDSNLQTQISDLKTKFESFVPGLTYKVVSALPTADILNDVIYLVPADSTGSQNVYNEYIYIDGNWELIGTTATTQAITVDSALSETSTNPVQNKVVTTELKNMGRVYTSLAELGLDSNVSLNNAINAMPSGSSALFGVTMFTDYQNIFPYTESNDQYSRVYIVKSNSLSRVYAVWFMKDGTKYAIANIDSNNQVAGWERITLNPYNSNVYRTYGGIWELNTAKGTSITLVANEDNTQKILDTLGPREEFVEWYGNSNNRFGIDAATFGDRINCLRITKIDATNGYVFAMMNTGVVLNRIYANGVLGAWCDTIRQFPIDSTLSSTSENPVQNKVIAAEISTLKSKAYSEKITGYTIKETSYYKDSVVEKKLYKKNGIAFVNLEVDCVNPSDSRSVYIEGLPPAAISLYFNALANNSNKLNVSIDESGELLLDGGTGDRTYRIAFSYPIAD